MNRKPLISLSFLAAAVAVVAVHAALVGEHPVASSNLSAKLGTESRLGAHGRLASSGTPVDGDEPTSAVELSAGREPSAQGAIAAVYGGLPLHFEPNAGQTDPRVAFLSRGPQYTLFLTADQVTLALNLPSTGPGDSAGPHDERGIARVALGMKLVGANADPIIEGLDELAGKSNYFIGAKEDHVTGVPHYGKVAYRDVYPGVDLVLYGKQGRLEYDFVVAAGADSSQIGFLLRGAEAVHVDELGNLMIAVPGGELLQHAPFIYQEQAGSGRVPVGGRYELVEVGKGTFRVGFQIESHDGSKALVIDPVLSYSTYLGGSGSEIANDIAVDSSGNAYIVGYTSSADFPTAAAFQPDYAGGTSFVPSDAFVTKINPTGSALVYSTYIGTTLNDSGTAIAVDSSGSAYITGTPGTSAFPSAGTPPLPSSYARFFVTKFNAAGDALVYSQVLGGASTQDIVSDIAVDSSGNAYLTGKAGSVDFPTSNAIQPSRSGSNDAFVMKLNADGDAFVYSTYLGGSGAEQGYGIAADASGNAYIAGQTDSTDFTTVNPVQASNGGFSDLFIVKLSADGSTRTYSTYLGGSNIEIPAAIALNSAGNAFVTGKLWSSDFPTAGAAPASSSGGEEAFAAALTPAGSALVYSGYLGGSSLDRGVGISIDPGGNAHIVGQTNSSDFPTADAYQDSLSGSNYDGFYSVLGPDGSLVESTFIGAAGTDGATGVDARWGGAVYVTGRGNSSDFPTFNALQDTYGGGNTDAWVMKFCDWSIDPTSDAYAYTAGGGTVDVTAGPGCGWTAVSNDSWITVTGGAAGSGNDTVTYTVDANPTIIARQGTITIGGATFTVDQGGAPCTYGLSPTSASFTQSAGVDSVAVTTLTGCPWTAVSNDSWIHVTGGASGSDSGTVDYSVDQNLTASLRSGSMTIAGHSFPVDQAAGTVPADPTSLAVASSSARSVSLTWTDNAGDETEYRVERKEGAAGSFAQIVTLASDTQSYADPAVQGQTQYTYRVLACNLVGCSSPSNEVSVTTKALTYFIGDLEAVRSPDPPDPRKH